MKNTSSSHSRQRHRSDGFDTIPAQPANIFILSANPVLYHLPTKLTRRKHDVWQLPPATQNMRPGDAVILWQGGPDAGIYGIATPDEERFETPGVVRSNLALRYSGINYSIRLKYCYVLPTPLLKKDIESLRSNWAFTPKRRGALRSIGHSLKKDEWKLIYKLLWQSRQEFVDSGRTCANGSETELETLADTPLTVDVQDAVNSNDTKISNLFKIETLAHKVRLDLTQALGSNELLKIIELSEKLGAPVGQIIDSFDHIETICTEEQWTSLTSMAHLEDDAPVVTFGTSLASEVSPNQAISDIRSDVPHVKSFDRNRVPNPFEHSLEATADRLVEQLIADPRPEISADIYARVKARGSAQFLFAKMMHRLYRNCCAFCGFSIRPALEAAHIKPWPLCTPSERLMPSNGLLLCCMHHKLFDAGLLMLSDKFQIRVVSPETLHYMSVPDEQNLLALDGAFANVPFEPKLRPTTHLLGFRRNLMAQFFGNGLRTLQ